MFDKLGGLGSLLKNAKKIQSMMEGAQLDLKQELEKTEVEGEAGAGAVKAKMNGRYDVTHLEVDDETWKESKEVVLELIAAAVNTCSRKVEEITRAKMIELTQSLTNDEE